MLKEQTGGVIEQMLSGLKRMKIKITNLYIQINM